MSKLSKILTAIAAVISVIGIFFFIRILMAGDDAIATDAGVQASILAPYITFSIWIVYLTVAVTIIFSIRNLIKNPENLKKTLIGLVAMGIILAISYSMASDAAVTDVVGKVIKDGEAGSVSKWVDTGIIYSIILGAIGLVLFIVDLLKGMIKA